MKPFCYEVELYKINSRSIGRTEIIVEYYTNGDGARKVGNIVYYDGVRIMRVTDKEYRKFGEVAILIMARALSELWEDEIQKKEIEESE